LEALPRGHAEEVMAQQTPPRAGARAPNGSRPTSAAPGAATPARLGQGATAGTTARSAEGIVEQLRSAGVDIHRAHETVSGLMNGEPLRVDGRTMRVLGQHFPDMAMLGLDGRDPLAVALRDALGRAAASSPRAGLAPPRTPQGARQGATGGGLQRSPAPNRAARTTRPTGPGQSHSANQRPAGAAVERLARSGIDLRHVRDAIDNTLLWEEDLPAHVRNALERAGIDTHLEQGMSLVDHPLMQLGRAIRQAENTRGSAGERRQADGTRPGAAAPSRGSPRGSTSQASDIVRQLRAAGVDLTEAHGVVSALINRDAARVNRQTMAVLRSHFPNMLEVGLQGNAPLALALRDALGQHAAAASGATLQPAAAARPVEAGRTPRGASDRALEMPARGAGENNGQYAWRVHTRNPGASAEDIASAVVRASGGSRRDTIAALNEHIATYEKIVATFDRLRPLSRADAERMEFKDAAIYNQEGDGAFSRDLATVCLFGEELSLSNPAQKVIGLAPVASDPRRGFDAQVNKEVVFMDMNELAKYLVSNPKHPMNNAKLDADNIASFAFRVS
jgi:Avirulence AvrPtoB, BAK1-binding domain